MAHNFDYSDGNQCYARGCNDTTSGLGIFSIHFSEITFLIKQSKHDQPFHEEEVFQN